MAYTHLKPGAELELSERVYFNRDSTDLSVLIQLTPEHLKEQEGSSAALEETIFQEVQAVVEKWRAQASQTLNYRKAQEYLKVHPVTHTSNQWTEDQHGRHEMSNMVYCFSWREYERTEWSRAAQKSVPVAWELSWSLHYNTTQNPDHSGSGRQLAGQDRKVFKDRAAMEKYLQTRLSATRSGETPPPVSSAPSRRPTIQPLTPGRRYRPRGGIPRRPRKLKGFRALYFKYLYLLGAIPKRHPRHRAAFVSRRSIIKFDRYQEQFQYLMKNRIETANQLSMQYDALQAQIDALTDQRRELYKIRRAGHGGDAVTDEITGLTARVRELRRELKLCARIERDIPTVKEAVQADTSETRSVIHEKTDKSRPQRHFETGRSLSGGGGPGR